jgi:hypothetical protein
LVLLQRNELCHCGSGKRYKHCHGRLEAAADPTAADSTTAAGAFHRDALAAQQAGELTRAEALYRQALQQDPADAESLHMLGVVQFQRMRFSPALDLLWDAAERTAWNDAVVRQNLGLVLAKLMSPRANARQEALVAAYLERTKTLAAEAPASARISVVLAVRNGAHSVARAIACVAAQTQRDIELIVVDDGSTDGTAAAIAASSASLSCPVRVLRRDARGLAAAANDGAAHAQGRYLAFLEVDDTFAPERLARMSDAIARSTPLWGFSLVTRGDGVEAMREARRQRGLLAQEPVSFALLRHDLAQCVGNLFVERSLFDDVGGLRVVPFTAWDFAVRAAQRVEPVLVDAPLYVRGPVAPAPAAAVERRSHELVLQAIAGAASAANPFCPQASANRDVALRAELRAGHGDRLPVPLLRALAAEWRAQPASAAMPSLARETSSPSTTSAAREKSALVVLGAYRSGTSAIARALNLGGAFLPQRVIAARLGINPKGFWESEAVTDLDVRLLHDLKGDWNRVDFDLPSRGPLVDEFLATAREILAFEYEERPFILIKDPRISVLAPLWQRALAGSGYRPAYVVSVRNPLEVARSIEAQGDMPLADGLALWLAYMQRVERFIAASGVDAIHVRYTGLLEDWRGVVQSIAQRLRVPLDIDAQADEIDRFLEADMRNHRATDAEVEAGVPGAQGDAIRALYRELLARCAMR